jgi:hypothetical protein
MSVRGRPKGPAVKELKIRPTTELYIQLNNYCNSEKIPTLNKAILRILSEFLVPKVANPGR